MRPSDPRIRQTLNQISQNLESANETAQEGIYAFSHNYIEPCLAGFRGCLGYCSSSACLGRGRDDPLRRRNRGRSRGRAESNFDFYDDWDYDEDAREDSGLLGWGHDELERLLAGSGAAGASRTSNDQPRRPRRMSYGSRRKGAILPNDEGQDPTIIPSSSILGFLERFPWRIGARGTRYRPSGADLQENPGGLKRTVFETEPLLEGSDESDENAGQVGSRKDPVVGGAQVGWQRSATQSSRETSNSLSSRGDLFPSDEEEDAVPLDDEFAATLGPRIQSIGEDDQGATRSSTSGTSTKGFASSPNSGRTGKGKRKARKSSARMPTPPSKSPRSPASEVEVVEVLTIDDLKKEEERAQREEEIKIEKKRQAARNLARKRGLSDREDRSHVEVSINIPFPSLFLHYLY